MKRNYLWEDQESELDSQDVLFKCNALWGGIDIDYNGDIHNCCARAVNIGNINETPFEEIWNGEKIKQLRALSHKNKLFCGNCGQFWRTMKLDEVASSLPLESDPGLVKYMLLTPSHFCNASCYMCSQDHRNRETVNYEKIKEILLITKPDHLILAGGEVFYAPGIEEFMEWLKKERPVKNIGMNTNGAIPEKFIDYWLEIFEYVDFSILGTTPEVLESVMRIKFDTVMKNAKKLIELRGNKKRPRITWAYTTVPTNFHEAPDAVLKAEDMGFDALGFAVDMATMPHFLFNSRNLSSRIFRKLKFAIDKVSIPIDTHWYEKLLGYCPETGNANVDVLERTMPFSVKAEIIKEKIMKIMNSQEKDTVAFFGAGSFARRMLVLYPEISNHKAFGVIFDDNAKDGEQLEGISVLKPSPENIMQYRHVIVATDTYMREMSSRCGEIFSEDVKIHVVYGKVE
jgi:MoaA/NifB/PqqE/SkfB family radical SAM enzyme